MANSNYMEQLFEGEVTDVLRRDAWSRVSVKTKKGFRVIVGSIPVVQIGDHVEISANAVSHPKYGQQLQFSGVLNLVDNTEPLKYLIEFISSRRFKGVGYSSANQLVSAHGEKLIELVNTADPALFKTVGVSQVVIKKLVQDWQFDGPNNVMRAHLCLLGLTPRMAENAVKTFGSSALNVVKADPYRLTDLDRVGFGKADMIARKMGWPPSSPERIEAACVYCLEQCSQEGHCYLPVGLLAEKCQTMLGGDMSLATIANSIVRASENHRIILDGHNAYRPGLKFAEDQCILHLARLMPDPDAEPVSSDVQETLARIGGFENIQFGEKQLMALKQVTEGEGVFVITGGPGVGKTTTVRAICALWEDMGLTSYRLCAPTGRAAKRLSEATSGRATTIHRLLGFDPFKGGFVHNADNQLLADAVLVDEASMLDISLFHHLLCAIPDHCRLVIVGDVDQLPSVGPGRVLGDLIDSDVFPVTRLDRVYRQSNGSTIVSVAHTVLAGKVPDLPPSPKGGNDCLMIEAETSKDVMNVLADLFVKKFPKKNIKPNDVQVLTPMRERGVGVKDINPVLQEILNPASANTPEMSEQGRLFRVGDRVMQIKNNYKIGAEGIFNGDVGFITHVDENAGTVSVSYDGEPAVVHYSDDILDELVLSYCSTIHKAQGSEYPVVIIVLHDSHSNMLQNNLVYTAITRAKSMCIVVGTKSALQLSVKNTKQRSRYTGMIRGLRAASS